jgi:glycosyltransferase involved in cell wall biosynthesis
MKRVLIITYYWPPTGGAGVQRWLKFAKYLPEYGWEPVIYTPENPEIPALDESLLNDIAPHLTILKKPIWEPFDLYKKFTGRKKTEKLGVGFLSETKTTGFTDKIALWIRGNFFIPDAKCFWIKPSIRFLKKYLSENPVEIIISTGPPHSLHLIAMELKKSLNIPWLADFRDPWTEIDFFDKLRLTNWAIKRHNYLENCVLHFADKIITVGPTMSESFLIKNKIESTVITNGFDDSDLNELTPPPDEKFTILHVGFINKDRNHPVFWETILELISENLAFKNALHLHFVGKTDIEVRNNVSNYGLDCYVTFTPYLNHNSAIVLEQAASVLYLPINNTPNARGILTGKVYEYLLAKRPILAVAPPDGDLATILNETKAGFVSGFNDKISLKNNILSMFNQHNDGKLVVNSTGIHHYSRRNLTKKMAQELDKIVK